MYRKELQAGVVHLLLIIVVLGILVAVGFVLLKTKQPEPQSLPITPSQLMPTATSADARAAICDLMSGDLYEELCREKFNVVRKEDIQKLNELTTIASKIRTDELLSDYDRLLLGQLVFTSLPTKDSVEGKSDDVLGIMADTAHAKESIDIQELMAHDLQDVVGNLPKGDNAWVINVMVSKYEWINGQRQPIYSDQFSEVYDPYPSVSTEPKDETKIQYNVRSVVGSQSTGELGSGTTTSGEMIAYTFSIMSWNSQAYGEDSVLTLAESGPDPMYLTSNQDLSEDGYSGEDILASLLSIVETPSKEQTAIDEKSDIVRLGSQPDSGVGEEREYEGYLMKLSEFAALQNPTVTCPISEIESYYDVAICATSYEGAAKLKEDLEKGIISPP